ncbi:MAG: hypothetical protein NZ936_07420, partial [Alphaproteobacteria bacterium]|nr:hypothetical protein [Alphaproteobacteria bacterium]
MLVDIHSSRDCWIRFAHYDAASNSKSQSVPEIFRRRPVQIRHFAILLVLGLCVAMGLAGGSGGPDSWLAVAETFFGF